MKKLLSTLLVFSTMFTTVACTSVFAKETVTTSMTQEAELNNEVVPSEEKSPAENIQEFEDEEGYSESTFGKLIKKVGWSTYYALLGTANLYVAVKMGPKVPLVTIRFLEELMGVYCIGSAISSLFD